MAGYARFAAFGNRKGQNLMALFKNPFKKKELDAVKKIADSERAELPRARREPVLFQRDFKSGLIDNLTYSFSGSQTPINEQLRHQLVTMRARARDVVQNNDYGRRFVQMVKQNVVGQGIKLQARTRRDANRLDVIDNTLIERAWRDWGKPSNCSVDRKLSFNDIEKLVIGTVATDGEVLIHMVTTPGRDYGLRLRVLPAEYLDENYNDELANGNTVVMGIEFSPLGEVVQYHLRKRKIKSWVNVYPERDYIAIPADDIIHLFITDQPEQARGIPWLNTAIRRLHMIGKYEEAELVAAFAGAAKMGFYKPGAGQTISPTEIVDGNEIDEFDEGEHDQKLEAGTIETLPAGTDFVGFDPTHPTTAFDGFMRAVLRGAAAGLDVAYSGLSNDLENVNFSSIRAGVLAERDAWRSLQEWLKMHMHGRIYDRWLPSAILNGRLPLPMKKVDSKFQEIVWQGRGWPWVDPKKDAEANRINLGMGVETRREILAAQGRDYDDTLTQLAYEQQQAEALGVNITDFEQSAEMEAPDDDQ